MREPPGGLIFTDLTLNSVKTVSKGRGNLERVVTSTSKISGNFNITASYYSTVRIFKP